MRWDGPLPCVLLLSAALSGCVGGGTESGLPSESGATDGDPSGTASLVVLVINPELAPLAGANVQVDELSPTATDPDGRARVTGLAPGSHTLLVQALGYSSVAQKVEVADALETEVRVTLDAIPIETPYQELVILKGFSVCDVSAFVLITVVDPCPLGEPKRQVKAEVAASWRYGVFEMQWNSQDSFAFYTSPDGNCLTSNPCWGAKMGRSPLRLEAAPENESIAKDYAAFTGAFKMYPTGNFTLIIQTLYAGLLQHEVNQTAYGTCAAPPVGFRMGCPGVGGSVGIPFTMYITVFHYAAPAEPQKYSAIPDG